MKYYNETNTDEIIDNDLEQFYEDMEEYCIS